MSLRRSLIAGGIALSSLIYGCDNSNVERAGYNAEEVSEEDLTAHYFAEIDNVGIESASDVSITSGDFDNDGDLDIIVSSFESKNGEQNTAIRLYYFKGDGKGNFSQ